MSDRNVIMRYHVSADRDQVGLVEEFFARSKSGVISALACRAATPQASQLTGM
jgi:hypothetical protein